MAQIVKLRRSSVSGQKPTNSNLQLGEIALNTTDGKAFMSVSGSGGPSVEEFILTNTVNTGSVNLSGSLNLIGNETISGSLVVSGSVTTEDLYVSGNIYLGTYDLSDRIIVNALFSSSLLPDSDGDHWIGGPERRWRFFGLTGSFDYLHGISGQTLTIDNAIVSGTFIGNASGLTNVPFVVTGSDVDGNNYEKQFTKLHFDSDTGLNVSESVPGTAFISIGSHFRDIFVSGSGMLRATGSDAFEVIGDNGIEVTVSNGDSNYDGTYSKELKFSAFTLSSSLNTRINNITGSLDELTGSFNSFTSSTNTHLSDLDNFTSSVVLTNQTSSMTVLSASYALTAAYALNAGAGGSGGGISDGAYAELNQTTPSTTWTFNHNLGQKYPIFQVFDTDDNVIIPSQITAISTETATITFPSAQSGRVIASLGTGPGGMTQQFSSATTWSLNHNMGTDYPIVTVYDTNRKIIFPNEIKSIDGNNIEVYFSAPVAGHLNVAKGGHIISGSVDISGVNLDNSGLVSSSIQISNYGYAITGSNTFIGNQNISGSLTIDKARLGSTCLTLTTGNNQTIFDLNGFDGANFDYVIKNGVNMRAGMLMSVWDGTNVSYAETSTTDLGNTSAVTFYVTNTGLLKTDIDSGTWSVEFMYRALKCS